LKPLGQENDSFFSDLVLELYKHPQNFHAMKNPSAQAELVNHSCGDKVHFFVKIEKGKITDASFVGTGCAISTASASLLTEMVKGKTVAEAKHLTAKQLFSELGNVIQTRVKCATLGLSAMKKALETQ
jgi:SUF system NifU family Fe-S assembly protein